MKLDFRDEVFAGVEAHMRANPRSALLTNDMGAMGLDAIRAALPGRVFNLGISEQNMASVAAGLAASGWRVFVYGIIAHICARAYEQLRVDVCCQNLPVTILGVGSGLSYGADGPTHHGVHDVGLMRTLPNLTILNPADGIAARRLVDHACGLAGPSFIRMDKEQLDPLYPAGAEFSSGMARLRDGTDAVLFATGVLSHRACEVADGLRGDGISVRVVDVYRLKPVDAAALRREVGTSRLVCSLEENLPGGLAAILAESLVGLPVRFLPVHLPDEAFLGAASRGWAERRFHMTTAALADRLRQAVREKETAPC